MDEFIIVDEEELEEMVEGESIQPQSEVYINEVENDSDELDILEI